MCHACASAFGKKFSHLAYNKEENNGFLGWLEMLESARVESLGLALLVPGKKFSSIEFLLPSLIYY